MVLEGYQIAEQLYQGTSVQVFRAIRENDQKKVVLKISSNDSLSLTKRFEAEYETSQKFDSQRVIKYVDCLKLQDKTVLVMPDNGEVSIRKYLTDGVINFEVFLKIAIQIMEGLAHIHQNHVIHKDINIANIIINTGNFNVHIIDFGISSTLSRSFQELVSPDLLEGTLAYISPEQTGRMNRPVDYRSDIYSAGVVFYEILTSKLPFEQTDPMELVYHHLTQPPTPPNIQGTHIEDITHIPEVISQIVLKMLAKNAEDRYQTALGVVHDLKRCLEEWQTKQQIERFDIAHSDNSGNFQIPHKLYGRQEELGLLLEGFDKMMAGESQFLTVKGFSGIGKSAIIQEIHKPLAQHKGYFIQGKYDQLRKNIPYYAVIQAFTSLTNQLLTESATEIDKWKEKILSSVGNNGQVIIDIIPEIKLIIGEQPPMQEANLVEAQQRFKLTLLNFIRAFAQEEHPLTLFLDDLQWADLATLELIEELLKDPSIKYLYILGAYRNNEVDDSHPLTKMLHQVSESREVYDIEIQPLLQEHLENLIQDTLRVPYSQEISDLAALVRQKTKGNPFFASELIKRWYVENCIMFDYEKGQWTWDLEKAGGLKSPDNVVDFLLQKMENLPESAKVLLMYAAAIGSSFETDLLVQICPIAEDEIKTALQKCIDEGLINYSQSVNRFAHDRVQQASYLLLPQDQKASIHYQIGDVLWGKEQYTSNPAEIFKIIDHLNQGVNLVQDESKKIALANLNTQAGQKAKTSNAFQQAQEYLEIAQHLFGEEGWEKYPSEMFDLQFNLAELLCLQGNLAESETLAKELLPKTDDVLRKADIYALIILRFNLEARFTDSIATTTEAFQVFGESFPDADGLEQAVQAEIGAVFGNIGERAVSDLLHLPICEDLTVRAKAKVLGETFVAAYLSDPNLFAFYVSKTVNYSLQHGNFRLSPYGYGCFGIIVKLAMGNLDMGYELGKLAIKLAESFNDAARKSIALFHMSAFIGMGFEPIERMIANADKGTHHAIEAGDSSYIGFLSLYKGYYPLLLDTPLLKVLDKLNQINKLNKNINNLVGYNGLEGISKSVRYLAGEDSELELHDIAEQDEYLSKMDASSTVVYGTFRTQLYLMLGMYEDAYRIYQLCEPQLPLVAGSYWVPQCHFLAGMSVALAYQDIDKLKEYMELVKPYAQIEENAYYHVYLLLEAELYRLENKSWETFTTYQKIIERTNRSRETFLYAFTSERLASFCIEQNMAEQEKLYIQNAFRAYQRWGAIPKIKQLQKRYSFLTNRQVQDQTQTTTHGSVAMRTRHRTIATTGTKYATEMGQFLDLNSVIKSYQTVSSEINLEKLLQTMTQIVMENAGAERVFIIRPESKGLTVQADFQGNIMINKPLESYENEMAISVVQYVTRIRKSVLLDKATDSSSKFVKDNYIQQAQPKSILCLPILKQSNLVAVIYLENNISNYAFKSSQIEVLNMLASQMAISLENALLYENLEQKVEERTIQLREKNDILETQKHVIESAHKKITSSINYAERIQKAILPQPQRISMMLPQAFVFFRPRDVVSGDFYWTSFVRDKDGNKKVVFATGDCTGHGVPGAFMSMAGANLLAQIVNDRKISDPAFILDLLHAGIRDLLQQDENENRDGMDISISTIDWEKKTLEYGGAKRPLYYVQDGEIHQIKGDIYPVGGFLRGVERAFTTHTISFAESPMMAYTFSDGYPDQIGGTGKGVRKFMTKRFRKMLFEISDRSVREQEIYLGDVLDKWKGNERQMDDILVVGMRLENHD